MPYPAHANQIFTFGTACNPPSSPDARVVTFYEMAGAPLGAGTFEPRKYESLSAQETVDRLPAPYHQDVVPKIQQHVNSGEAPVLVMLDDDPTGTQTCHDIAVLTVWDHDTLLTEFRTGYSGFFILTNSRAFPPDEAYNLILTIAKNVAKAAKEAGKDFEIVLRGDSTLRGHLPQEPEAVEEALGKFDGWIVAPFFFQGGRYTIDDVHYVREGDTLAPASETPFAKDASFGYRSSNLKDYILEKCGSRFSKSDLSSVTINDIREGGPDRVAQKLLEAPKGGVLIVNAAAESDMFVFAAGLLQAEKQGKRFLYRTGAAFVSARLGIEGIDPLSMKDLGVERTDKYTGGLIVAGSYVPKTTAQLERLRERRGSNLAVIELDVEQMISSQDEADQITKNATQRATDSIGKGEDVLVMTSRKLITGKDSRSSLNIGSMVAAALVKIVENIEVRPRYIIAKVSPLYNHTLSTKANVCVRAALLRQMLQRRASR